MSRKPVLIALFAAAGGCTDASPPTTAPALTVATPPTFALAPKPDSVVNRYIVVLDHDVGKPAEIAGELIARYGGAPFHLYTTALKGFAVANLPPGAVEALRRHPAVAYVEEDRVDASNDVQVQPLPGGTFGSGWWAVDRVDMRGPNFNSTRRFAYTGAGVHVYILDSGINRDHQEFAGRIGNGVVKLSWSSTSNPYFDQKGHGTAVAGVAVGAAVGLAPGATVHSVRINDGDGGAYISDEVAGIDWVAANHIKPAVANLSFEGHDFSVKDALEGAIRAGVTFTKSAGNGNVDAFGSRGNRAAGLIVAGATNVYDQRWVWSGSSGSNFGPTLALFAPGENVISAGKSGTASYVNVTGTSFAAPYAAGVAALILQQAPSALPWRVKQVLTSSATQGAVSNDGAGSPDLLLYSLFTSGLISGPTSIQADEYSPVAYTWAVQTAGGDDQYTYRWQVWSSDGSYEESSAPSYWRTVFPGDAYTLTIQLTIGSVGEENAARSITVDVTPYTPPPPPPDCGEFIC